MSDSLIAKTKSRKWMAVYKLGDMEFFLYEPELYSANEAHAKTCGPLFQELALEHGFRFTYLERAVELTDDLELMLITLKSLVTPQTLLVGLIGGRTFDKARALAGQSEEVNQLISSEAKKGTTVSRKTRRKKKV